MSRRESKWHRRQNDGKEGTWGREIKTTNGPWGKLREISDTKKWNNIRIIEVPEEEERKRGTEHILEQIIAENFPNLGKETGIQVQEAQRTPLKINKNRSTPQHKIMKLANFKDKEQILKAARDKRSLTYRGRNRILELKGPNRFFSLSHPLYERFYVRLLKRIIKVMQIIRDGAKTRFLDTDLNFHILSTNLAPPQLNFLNCILRSPLFLKLLHCLWHVVS